MRMVMTMLAAAATVAACGSVGATEHDPGAPLQGEGAVRTVALDGFDRIELAGPDNVEVTLGDSFSIRVEADPETLERLRIARDGDTLVVGRRRDGVFGSMSDSPPARIYVTLPALRGAAIAGSGDMTVDRAEAEAFEATIAGSGDLRIAALTARSAEFDIAGSGTITAAGAASDVEVNIAGSGNVEIAELRAERIEAAIAGSGDVNAHASESAEAELIGSGDVRIAGGARCRSTSIGSGTLRCG